MRKIRSYLLLACLMLVCCACILFIGAVGDANDPLISVSYLYQRYSAQLMASLGIAVDSKLEETEADIDARLDRIYFPATAEGTFATQFTWLELSDGDVVELQPFASFVLIEGEGKLMLLEGEVLDLSTGGSCTDSSMLTPRHRYFAVENTLARIRVYGTAVSGMVDGVYQTDTGSLIPTEERFLDVGDGFWAAPYIWRLYEMGVVNGVDAHRFAPGELVTRGAFVTILGRLSGIDPAAYEQASFTDVWAEDWFSAYVAWAAETGITNGFEDGSFRPGENISREQLAVMLQRYIRASHLETIPVERESFADEDLVSDWALEAVNLMKDCGLMNGRGDNRFEPKGTATRAEICAVVCRIADMMTAVG